MKSRLLPALLLFSVYSFGQDSSFQLKDYKYRTPGFKALMLDLNLSANTSRSEYQFGSGDESTNIILAPAQLAFTKIVSTETRLHQSTFTLLPWVNITQTKENNEEIKFNEFQTSFQWNRSDRLYKRALYFIEFGNILDASV